MGCLGGIAGGLSKCLDIILDGEDSAGADSGRLRGGTGGGTGTSSVPLDKLIDETEADLEWKGLAEWSESNTLQTSVLLEVPDAGGGVSGVLGEFGADAVLSVSLSGILL